METRVDYKNPDKNLRTRKLIGMSILEGLEYKPKTDSWENGKYTMPKPVNTGVLRHRWFRPHRLK